MTVLEKAKAKLDAAQRGMRYRLPGYDKSDLQWWTAYIEGADDQKREDSGEIEALQAAVESMDESCKKQLVAMASHVAELQAAQPHWVSVFDDLPRHNAVVVVSDGNRSWDVGQFHFLVKADDRTYWWWKKNTTRKVLWWMYKEDALPDPPKEDEK